MNLALNPFDKGRKPETIEGIVITEKPRMDLIERYINENKHCVEHNRTFPKTWAFKPLTSHEIYLTSLMIDDPARDFFSVLINQSYIYGHNIFIVKLKDWKYRLLNKLKGTKHAPLELKVEGQISNDSLMELLFCNVAADDVGNNVFVMSVESSLTCNNAGNFLGGRVRNCTIKANRVSMKCGYSAQESSFIVDTAKDEFGEEAMECKFTADIVSGSCGTSAQDSVFNVGYVGGGLGPCSRGSKFFVEDLQGTPGDYANGSEFEIGEFEPVYPIRPLDCVYRTRNKETYDKILHGGYYEGYLEKNGNRLELIE